MNLRELSVAAILGGALALGGCAPPPPSIIDFHAPYQSGKMPGAARPMPRPVAEVATTQRIWPGCIRWPDDCGGELEPQRTAETLRAEPTPPGWTRPDVPPLEFTPELPAPDPTPEVDPEPQPEGETEQWGPA